MIDIDELEVDVKSLPNCSWSASTVLELITRLREAEAASTMLVELSDKVAQQAAVIEKLRYFMQQEINYHFVQAGPKDLPNIKDALAIPTDSKQILADWMREQMGEPVAGYSKGECFHELQVGYAALVNLEPLFKLPECLK